ncbi:hypothetical protein MXD81_14985, partial [Microbacteriaceae bacterium K1510]|nr:hypothetical protein [Microbacteriaceae bacterium K1510]
VNVYEGTSATGYPVLPNSHLQIPGVIGSKRFYASEDGAWKLSKQDGTELRNGTGQSFYTGTLPTGNYTLLFDPANADSPSLTSSLEVGMVELYRGSDSTGQKLSAGQRIQASA